jgi:hypothetical protein
LSGQWICRKAKRHYFQLLIGFINDFSAVRWVGNKRYFHFGRKQALLDHRATVGFQDELNGRMALLKRHQ